MKIQKKIILPSFVSHESLDRIIELYVYYTTYVFLNQVSVGYEYLCWWSKNHVQGLEKFS
jgi:hypothetical protein